MCLLYDNYIIAVKVPLNTQCHIIGHPVRFGDNSSDKFDSDEMDSTSTNTTDEFDSLSLSLSEEDINGTSTSYLCLYENHHEEQYWRLIYNEMPNKMKKNKVLQKLFIR